MAPIGAPVRRKEDLRFLTGRGTYTDDINRPGQLYAFILRSPHAHAADRRASIRRRRRRRPGVVAVYTGADLAADGVGGLPCGWQIQSKDGSPMAEPPHPVLAIGRVRHVGDPVAVVIAETRGAGQGRRRTDRGRLCERARRHRVGRRRCKPGAPLVHDEAPGNLCYDWHIGDKAAVDAALRQGGARRQARPRQQPARPQRDGAARRDRRVRPRAPATTRSTRPARTRT